MQNLQQDNPLPLAGELDRETFQRVWRRVMPEDRADCPIQLTGEEQTAPAPSEPRSQLPAPRLPEEAAPEDSPLLPEESGMSLGRSSAVYTPLLQELIDRSMGSWRFCQQLARRSGGTAARVLSAMAADHRRHAKRLSAADFLISGVRYLPTPRKGAPVPPTLPGALREAFAAEQQGESLYRAAAAETFDEALRLLFLELAEEERAHACAVRTLLEQL